MEDLTEAELKRLWPYCSSNKDWLEASHNAGCFYCNRIFPATQIKHWVPDDAGPTALCPHCGIDSVLPDSKVPVSEQLLRQMHRRYF